MAQKAQKARPPMTQAARERIEAKMYLLEAPIQREMTEGIQLDIAMEYARERRIGRAQARDIRQRLARDFRRF